MPRKSARPEASPDTSPSPAKPAAAPALRPVGSRKPPPAAPIGGLEMTASSERPLRPQPSDRFPRQPQPIRQHRRRIRPQPRRGCRCHPTALGRFERRPGPPASESARRASPPWQRCRETGHRQPTPATPMRCRTASTPQAALATVDRGKAGALPVRSMRRPAAVFVAARAFDLDHVGAEIRKQLRAMRLGQNPA
jgi:hypothetical protein